MNHHCASHINSVKSQDHQPTTISDMRHLNNRIILHLCVLVVPLSRRDLLLHHWAMILNCLLIFRCVLHARLFLDSIKNHYVYLVLTLISSPNVFLNSHLSHALLSRILTCRCIEFYDALGFGEDECGSKSAQPDLWRTIIYFNLSNIYLLT